MIPMTKPMYCPLAFGNSQMLTTERDESFPWLKTGVPMMECTPDCAWSANDGTNYWCGIVGNTEWNINERPLEDDE